MKGLDVFIVRFLPFVLYGLLLRSILLSANGIEDFPFRLLHSQSAIYSISLFLISLSNDKYHCIWNRAMYAELIFVPFMNYTDAKFNLLNEELSVILLVSSFVLSLIATAYLAIRHFWKLNKKKICQTN